MKKIFITIILLLVVANVYAQRFNSFSDNTDEYINNLEELYKTDANMKKEQKQGTALAQEEQKEVRKEALEQKETQKGVWICGVEGRGEDVVKLLEKRGGRAHSITARQKLCVFASEP